jgi:long-chain acyl-CoA synthetase
MDQGFVERLMRATMSGMLPSVWADVKPDAVAVYDPWGTRTFGDLNANANRLARLLRAQGLKAGDAVALLCSNRAEFVETLAATLRAGFRITPVNWHLTADEVNYVVDNCEAKALIAETRFPAARAAAEAIPRLVAKIGIGAPVAGFLDYHQAIAEQDGTNIPDPVHGGSMLYTSGTTGRPKGVYRPGVVPLPPQIGPGTRAGYNPDVDMQLCLGPGYHAAPLAFDIRQAMAAGVPVTFIEKWDSEEVLRTIERQRITHAHMVPIMFQRLLALPEEVRGKYDLSSLRFIVHGAAPCPPETKHAMIEWLGPILHEYYAGSEGGAGYFISSEEWLRKPGSVGARALLARTRILDEEGNDMPPGKPGIIYFEAAATPFSYFKDPTKTAATYRDGFFTLGDVGYFDEDDYLFLTGRTAECIISGGVNIYPQEIDNELIKHPAIDDSCTIGVPNDEWGEEVKAVVTLRPGYEPSEALAKEILAFARTQLAGFKVPRTLEFRDDLPRSEAGKIQRGRVRAPYWEGRARQI